MKTLRDNHYLSSQELSALYEYSNRLKKYLGSNLAEIRLFGSKARGTGSSDSDLDILILVNTIDETIKEQLFDITVDINLACDVVICPIITTLDSYQSPLSMETYFYKATQEEGYVI